MGRRWPTNAAGQTYGSLSDVDEAGDEPDLYLARATNGRTGYLNRAECEAATGGTVSTLEEAAAWNRRLADLAAAGETISVPVYAEDGRTVVGRFEFANPAQGRVRPRPQRPPRSE